MSAQVSPNISLAYREQGAQQLGGSAVLSYDELVVVARKTVAMFGAGWGASTPAQPEIRAVVVRPISGDDQTAAPWSVGESLNDASTSAWVLGDSKDLQRDARWGQYQNFSGVQRQSAWVLGRSIDHEAESAWLRFANQLSIEPHALWGLSRKQDAEQVGPWGQYAEWLSRGAEAAWATARRVDNERWNPWLKFSRDVQVDWGAVVPPAGLYDAELVVPIQRVYIVLNSASLRRVDGNIYLPTFGMSLSLDTSSWTWGFSATLPGSVLSSLEPSSEGAPVEVEAMINGVAYRALVESISRSRSFGKSDISISGRGKTSLLDSPYAPVQSFGNSADRTAAQLMDDVLMVNGVSMGWVVDFGLEDWLVPAGVFAHQGSYISALNAIAGAAGGYVQPHATGQSLRVLPKYPSAPWDWASVTPDYELPSSVTTTESIEWAEKARYNRVFVSGMKSGVLGQVTRTGTDGAILAPMVTDSLITHTIAARQRGLSVLGDTGRIASVKLRLPVLAETGIITPGKMVRYVDGGTSRTGIVRSVGVDVGLPEVWQTIGVETHVN